MKKSIDLKILQLIAALVFFFSNCVFAYTTEVSFWDQRNQAIKISQSPSSTVKSALLPVASNKLAGVYPIASSLSTRFGTIREIIPSLKSQNRDFQQFPTVIHIQDIHQNEEAQRNIAHAIQQLIDDGQVDLIALEGAFKTIDLSSFRNFSSRDVQVKVADYLLKENKISGPIYAALTSKKKVPLISGVDDKRYYKANVRAYQDSVLVQSYWKKKLYEKKKKLEKEKREFFNEDLKRFDQKVQAYRENRISMSGYLLALRNESGNRMLPKEISDFLFALEKEQALDFNQVNQERERLLSSLLNKTDKTQSSQLVAASIAFRMGRLSHVDFYQYIEKVSNGVGIHLRNYPTLSEYVRYILLAQAINTEALFNQTRRVEKQIYARLIEAEVEKKLVAKSNWLNLAQKLVNFSLTPNEWLEYKNSSIALDLSAFESFYRYAEARDEAITSNLLQIAQKNKARKIVLVTGGFHTNGIKNFLLSQKESPLIITFTPKVTKVERGEESKYLSVFSQKKMSLEKFFKGEKLFLAHRPTEDRIRHALIMTGVDRLISKPFVHTVKQAFEKALGRSTSLAISAEVELNKRSVKIKAEGEKTEKAAVVRIELSNGKDPDIVDVETNFEIKKKASMGFIGHSWLLNLLVLIFREAFMIKVEEEIDGIDQVYYRLSAQKVAIKLLLLSLVLTLLFLSDINDGYVYSMTVGAALPQSLKTPRKNEVPVTTRGIRENYMGGEFHKHYIRLKTKLGEAPDKYKEKIVVLNGHIVIFWVRHIYKYGPVWVYAKKDVPKVASFLGTHQKFGKIDRLDKKNEISVSNDSFAKYIAGQTTLLMPKIRAILKEPPRRPFEKTIKRKAKGLEITFFTRMNGVSLVWAFKKEDLENVARLLDASPKNEAIKKLDPQNELVVTPVNLGNIGIHGGSVVGAKKLSKLLGPVMEKNVTKSFGPKEKKINFFIRKTGTLTVWAFRKEDKKLIAKLVNGLLKEGDIPFLDLEEEIGVFAHKLNEHFFGHVEKLKATMDEVLGNPPGISKTKVIKSGRKNVKFFTRRTPHFNKPFWAFNKEDILYVAKILKTDYIDPSIPRVAKDEVQVTSRIFHERFVGSANWFVPRLLELLKKPSREKPKKILKMGSRNVTFFIRRGVGGYVWTFKEKDVKSVARFLETEPVAQDNIPLLSPTLEVPITWTGMKATFRGNAESLRQSLIEKLGAVPRTLKKKQIKVNDKAISFFPRRKNKDVIWAFHKSNINDVASLLGREPRVQNEPIPAFDPEREILINHPFLLKFFMGDTKKNYGKLINKIGHPARQVLEKKVRVGRKDIVFSVRKYKFGTVQYFWSVKKSDLALLAKFLDTVLKSEVPVVNSPSEIPITVSGLSPHLIGTGKKLKDAFAAILGPVPKEAAEKKVLVGRKKIKFFVRRASNVLAWAFDASDLELVAQLVGTSLKRDDILELNWSHEIGVSKRQLTKYLVGESLSLMKKFEKKLGTPPEEPKKINLSLNGETASFFVRKANFQTMWAFDLKDLSKIARMFKLKVRKVLPRQLDKHNEIGVYQGQVYDTFIGSPNVVIEVFRELLGKPPKKAVHKSVQLGRRKIDFFTRKSSGSRIFWAFFKKDLDHIAKSLGLSLKNETIRLMDADDVLVTFSRLKHYFSPDHEKVKATLDKKLGPVDLKVLHKEIFFEKKTIKFELVRDNAIYAWSFKRKDLPLVSGLTESILLADADLLQQLDLLDAVALLWKDPLRLHNFIHFYYPKLSMQEVQELTSAGLRGISGDSSSDGNYFDDYDQVLDPPQIRVSRKRTSYHSFEVNGSVTPGVPYIQVTGSFTRKIIVRRDGTFSAYLPLPKTGQENEFQFRAINPKRKQMSPPADLSIKQTTRPVDVQIAYLSLLSKKREILKAIENDEVQMDLLTRSVEIGLLKHFTRDEKEGFRYLSKLKKSEPSPAMKSIYQSIEVKFKKIINMKFKLKKKGQRLYFFQKYVIFEMRRIRSGKAKGAINAMEQGLGKTLTTLVDLEGEEGLILSPNSVVSTWGEINDEFIKNPQLQTVRGLYSDRKRQLKEYKGPQVLTNIEYTQNMTAERKELISKPYGTLVIDEADFLGNPNSLQSKGTAKLDKKFNFLLTATPFKKVSQIVGLMKFLTDDERFQSPRAFAKAFRSNSRKTMDALYLLLHQHMIRIRKKDVFEEYDPDIPLEKQSDRLPKKNPLQVFSYEPHQVQLSSIVELFTKYQRWAKKHKNFETEEDQGKADYIYKEGFFPKLEAMRQILNDPAYIDEKDIESPKHLAMDQIVKKELFRKVGNKMVVFVRYRSQVEAYVKRYARYGARPYYGGLRSNYRGYRIDQDNNTLYYKTGKDGKFVFVNGKLVPSNAEKGSPILALDYERLMFQNDPESRIIVATYGTGSVGVTLTAANSVVYDDLPSTYRDEYQAANRVDRIDNQRKKYSINYYALKSSYPRSFLRSLPRKVRERYFDVGTYDEIQLQNLRFQKRIFHKVIDGVGDEDELKQWNKKFLKDQIPHLFKGGQLDEETKLQVDDWLRERRLERFADGFTMAGTAALPWFWIVAFLPRLGIWFAVTLGAVSEAYFAVLIRSQTVFPLGAISVGVLFWGVLLYALHYFFGVFRQESNGRWTWDHPWNKEKTSSGYNKRVFSAFLVSMSSILAFVVPSDQAFFWGIFPHLLINYLVIYYRTSLFKKEIRPSKIQARFLVKVLEEYQNGTLKGQTLNRIFEKATLDLQKMDSNGAIWLGSDSIRIDEFFEDVMNELKEREFQPLVGKDVLKSLLLTLAAVGSDPSGEKEIKINAIVDKLVPAFISNSLKTPKKLTPSLKIYRSRLRQV